MDEEKVYCSMYSRNVELYHHGIKGQKWGVTNGPPYPLNSDVSTGSRLKKTEKTEEGKMQALKNNLASLEKKRNDILDKIDELEENGIWSGKEYDAYQKEFKKLLDQEDSIGTELHKLETLKEVKEDKSKEDTFKNNDKSGVNRGWTDAKVKSYKDYNGTEYYESNQFIKNVGKEDKRKKIDELIDLYDFDAFMRYSDNNIDTMKVQNAIHGLLNAKVNNDKNKYDHNLDLLKDYDWSIDYFCGSDSKGNMLKDDGYAGGLVKIYGNKYTIVLPTEADSGYTDDEYIIDNRTGRTFVFRDKKDRK